MSSFATDLYPASQIDRTINNPDSQLVQDEVRKRLEAERQLEEANSRNAEKDEEIRLLKARLAATAAGL